MQLGISGKSALVCGASKGLGFACASALAAEGVEVVIVARTEQPLAEAAEKLKGQGGKVRYVVADVVSPDGRKAALAVCPWPDILVNNAAGPPPGDFRTWTRDTWIAALDANMISGIELIKATIDPMIARKWGRIINITSSSAKAPLDMLGLSNGARAGLTGFVAGLAREVAMHGVTINNMLPGMFATGRLQGVMKSWAAGQGKTPEVMTEETVAKIPTRRFGEPEEFGAVCAFLCSQHAGYINGQNILLDGGTVPTVF